MKFFMFAFTSLTLVLGFFLLYTEDLRVSQHNTTDSGGVLDGNFEKFRSDALQSVGERLHRGCAQNTELYFIFQQQQCTFCSL